METNMNVKEFAIRITEKTEFYYPVVQDFSGHSHRKLLSISWITPAYRKKYAITDNRMAFIDEEGKFYMLPYSPENVNLLKDSGYKLASFYVPGELHSYPVRHKTFWNEHIGSTN